MNALNFFKKAIRQVTQPVVVGLGLMAGLLAFGNNNAQAQQKIDTLINKKTKEVKPDQVIDKEHLKIVRAYKEVSPNVSAMPNVGLGKPQTQKVKKQVPLTRAERVAEYKLRRSKMSEKERIAEDENYKKNKPAIDAFAKKNPKTKTIEVIEEVPVVGNGMPTNPVNPQNSHTILSNDTTEIQKTTITNYIVKPGKTDTLIYDVIPGKGPWKAWAGPLVETTFGSKDVYKGKVDKGFEVGLQSRQFGAPGTFGSNFSAYARVGVLKRDSVITVADNTGCGCPTGATANPAGSKPQLFAQLAGQYNPTISVTQNLALNPGLAFGLDARTRNVLESYALNGAPVKQLTPQQLRAEQTVAAFLEAKLGLSYNLGKGWGVEGTGRFWVDSRSAVNETPRRAGQSGMLPYGDKAFQVGPKASLTLSLFKTFGSTAPTYSQRPKGSPIPPGR